MAYSLVVIQLHRAINRPNEYYEMTACAVYNSLFNCWQTSWHLIYVLFQIQTCPDVGKRLEGHSGEPFPFLHCSGTHTCKPHSFVMFSNQCVEGF